MEINVKKDYLSLCLADVPKGKVVKIIEGEYSGMFALVSQDLHDHRFSSTAVVLLDRNFCGDIKSLPDGTLVLLTKCVLEIEDPSVY